LLEGHCSGGAAVVALDIVSGFERLVLLHPARLASRLVDRLVVRLAVRPATFAVAATVAAVVAAAVAVACGIIWLAAVVVRLQELLVVRSADAGTPQSVRRILQLGTPQGPI